MQAVRRDCRVGRSACGRLGVAEGGLKFARPGCGGSRSFDGSCCGPARCGGYNVRCGDLVGGVKYR